MDNSATLLVHCPDQRGLVATVSSFLYDHHANILHADHHQDAALDVFLMRVEWDLEGFELGLEAFARQFEPIAERFRMRWHLSQSSVRQKIAIFVSRDLHCLSDLLFRHQTGELDCEVSLVISNHGDAESLAAFYGVPFVHIPVTSDTKAQAEGRQVALLDERQVDAVVLARYMQILSPEFVARYPQRIINVHHSFLPAFSGGRPYHRAYDRGVKLIGATSHYVTDALDEGPIIDQDVVRISHRDQLADLMRKGRDLERVVLARAVRWHIGNRILVYSNKTAVFV